MRGARFRAVSRNDDTARTTGQEMIMQAFVLALLQSQQRRSGHRSRQAR